MTRRYYANETESDWSWKELAAALLESQELADKLAKDVADLQDKKKDKLIKSLERKVSQRESKIVQLERELSTARYRLEEVEEVVQAVQNANNLLERWQL